MAILKDVLNCNGNVNSFIKAVQSIDIPSELYIKLRNERGDAELSDEEQSIIENAEEQLTYDIEPCEECGHYFTIGEGFYHFDGSTTCVLCEDCWRKMFPTDNDWSKYIVKFEEDLSDEEIDNLSQDELENLAEIDAAESNTCYYSEI